MSGERAAASPFLPAWPNPNAVAEAHALLAGGGVLAIPTESSYGLAVDPRSSRGVETIYRLKERDRGHPLPVVVASFEQLALLPIDLYQAPLRAVARHWPAALSSVVPLQRPIPAGGSGPGDGPTLAVRVPAHDALRAWLEALECPLTATSANLSGESPLLDPAAVTALFAEGAGPGVRGLTIDGGRLAGGSPSTLVAWRDGAFQTLRRGRFDARRLDEPLSPAAASTA